MRQRIIKISDSLLEKNPKLAKEWHPEKNGTLSSSDVTAGSGRKVWWKCKKGHVWQATIANRTIGRNCPYCCGKKVCKDNCLATINPGLSKEWHHEKNKPLTPFDVTTGSGRKVWWKCKKGHVWQATIANRILGRNCPYCCGKKVYKDNCLATVNPELSKEWHPEKNGTFSPLEVTTGSDRKVWWKCKKGHEWQAIVGDRNRRTGCPYCSGHKVCKDNCLATLNPSLAKEWHLEMNKPLTPFDVTTGSHAKVWWKCKKGHEWQAFVADRNRGIGCPYCSGYKVCKDNCLATRNPALVKEWHHEKNKPLTPFDVAAGSRRKVWWICKKGHEWQASVSTRNRGPGCPYCSGYKACKDNCLATLNPSLAEEWHHEKNKSLTPFDVTTGSGRKVWWKCKKGHEWQASLNNRSSGRNCPYCGNKKVCKDNCLATLNPALAKEWHPFKNEKLTPSDITPGCNKKVWWKCSYGHEWQAIVLSRGYHGTGCPACYKRLVEEGFYRYR